MQLDGVGVPFPHNGAQMFVYPHLLSHLTVPYFCSLLFVCLRQGPIMCLWLAWHSMYVEPSGLELRVLPASVSHVLGLKAPCLCSIGNRM